MKALTDNNRVTSQSPLYDKPGGGWVPEHRVFWGATDPIWTLAPWWQGLTISSWDCEMQPVMMAGGTGED